MVDLATVSWLSPADAGDAVAWPGVPSIENGWYPTAGAVNPAADEGIANWQPRELARRTDTLKSRVDLLSRRTATEVTVGPGGQWSTINEALAELSEQRVGYVSGGVLTRLRLRPGFVMREQVLVVGANLGWVEIVSTDAEVLIDRAYLTQMFRSSYPAFGAADGGVLPKISTLFSMMSTGVAEDRVGVAVVDGGSAIVSTGAGIKSAGSDGIRVENSGTISANFAIFSGAGRDGAYVAGAVGASLHGAVLSGAVRNGLFCIHGARVNAVLSNCSGAGANGIFCSRGALVNAYGASCRIGGTDAAGDISVNQGGQIAAHTAIGGTSIAINTVTASGIIFK